MVGRVFRPEFFAHWDQMPLYIDDYPYSGVIVGIRTYYFHLVEYGDPMVSEK